MQQHNLQTKSSPACGTYTSVATQFTATRFDLRLRRTNAKTQSCNNILLASPHQETPVRTLRQRKVSSAKEHLRRTASDHGYNPLLQVDIHVRPCYDAKEPKLARETLQVWREIVQRLFHGGSMPVCKITALEKAGVKSPEQIRKEDEQAVVIWKSQVDTIKTHIRQAAGNANVVAELEKMLDNCNLLWAEKIMQMEKSEGLNEAGYPSQLSLALEEKFDAALAKIQLLREADTIICQTRVGKPLLQFGSAPTVSLFGSTPRGSSFGHLTSGHDSQLAEIANTIENLKSNIGAWDILAENEELLDEEWKKVMKLISNA